MKCNKCNTDMRLDDVDMDNKLNYDNYWVCDKCDDVGCVEEVRAGKFVDITWQEG